jgi:MoaA/NifB/PqqE/SkfB family radical SAM enzyme
LAQAPSPDALAWLRAILDELRSRGGPSQIVLSGPDCLRHPQIDAMLELFADEQQITLQLLGPLTRLSEPALFDRVAALPALRGVRLSLYGARAETHDRIVGSPGAHAQVMTTLARCRARGIEVNVTCVITPENVAELPELLSSLRELGHYIELCVYHPESWGGTPLTWREVALERVVVHPDQLLAACERIPERDAAHARARHIAHCWIPARLRELVIDEVCDVQDNFDYAPACRECPARPRCPGISRPALERFGPGVARPISPP